MPVCDDPDSPDQVLGDYVAEMQSEAITYLGRYGTQAASMFRSEMKGDDVGSALLRALDGEDYQTAEECALMALGDTQGPWSCAGYSVEEDSAATATAGEGTTETAGR
jgi:hypothetical protein